MRVTLACGLVLTLLACGDDAPLTDSEAEALANEPDGPVEAPDDELPNSGPTDSGPVGPSGPVDGLLEAALQASLDEGGNL